MVFDEGVFCSLSGLWLADYFGRVEDAGRSGVDPDILLRLLGCKNLSAIHTLYLVFWGIQIAIPGIGEHVIRLVARPDAPGEVQDAALMFLRQVPGVRPDQIDVISSIEFRCPHAVAESRIAELRKAVAGRAGAAQAVNHSGVAVVARKRSMISEAAG